MRILGNPNTNPKAKASFTSPNPIALPLEKKNKARKGIQESTPTPKRKGISIGESSSNFTRDARAKKRTILSERMRYFMSITTRDRALLKIQRSRKRKSA